jgi:hypothetical protein
MSNETIKKFEIIVKLRGDNVYDLYIDGTHIASRGNHDAILEEANNFIKQSFLQEE